MFITALLIIAKSWKLSKYSSLDEYINTMWYIDAMEYYPVIKGNEVLIQTIIWMKFLHQYIQINIYIYLGLYRYLYIWI